MTGDPMLFPSRWPQALGYDPQDEPELCEACEGEGTCPECGHEPLEDPELCGECSGDLVCGHCGGTGRA